MDLNTESHLNIVFPQWQGSGPDDILYHGALKIKSYLDFTDFHDIDVRQENELIVEKRILGYTDILHQLHACCDLIQKRNPATILTIGGDCGVEPGPVSYLNHYCKNDMALVWFDAHGDLNTPQSSVSGHFHGMPLRTICGESDPAILDALFSTLTPEQVFLAGAREFDPPETAYIRENRLAHIDVQTLTQSTGYLADRIRTAGFSNAYIHIDLDVLDPETYQNIKHPTPGGIEIDSLCRVIRNLTESLNVVGMGIVEFIPDGDTGLEEIKKILSALKKGRS